jgi:Flp pilus assembly protein TadD
MAGNASDAELVLKQALSINPNDPEAMTRLAMAESDLGHPAQARALLENVLAIAPGYGLAKRALDRLNAVRPRR